MEEKIILTSEKALQEITKGILRNAIINDSLKLDGNSFPSDLILENIQINYGDLSILNSSISQGLTLSNVKILGGNMMLFNTEVKGNTFLDNIKIKHKKSSMSSGALSFCEFRTEGFNLNKVKSRDMGLLCIKVDKKGLCGKGIDTNFFAMEECVFSGPVNLGLNCKKMKFKNLIAGRGTISINFFKQKYLTIRSK